MSRYLVTGGAGFIGSYLVKELVKRGEEIIVLDDLSTGNISNLKEVKKDITFIKGDIRDRTLLMKILKNVDFVMHEAAKRSVPFSVENPFLFNDVNIRGHLTLLQSAKEANVKKLVFASSSSVYGDVKKFPEQESFSSSPKSPYAVTKLAGECYCKYFYEQYGLETVSLRYFNVFGPYQNPLSRYAAAIPIFIKNILENKAPIVYGDGLQSRDFTYIKNIVDANMLAIKAKGIGGDVINICSGNSITLLDVIRGINLLLQKDIKPKFMNERKGDVKKTLGDISKAKKLLGYKANISFNEGLKMTVDWYKDNPKMLKILK